MRFCIMALSLVLSCWSQPTASRSDEGKRVFVQRCSICHAERGDKPLSTGLPLNERSLTDDQIAIAVSGRLKNAPPEQKRAVALYIRSFMQK